MTQPRSASTCRLPFRASPGRLALRSASLLLVAALLGGCLGVSSRGDLPAGIEQPDAAAAEPAGTSGSAAPEEPTAEPADAPSDAPLLEPEPAVPPAEPSSDPEPSDREAGLPEVPEGEPSVLVSHGDRNCKAVALTYDAGSGADGAAAVLDVLKKYGLKVTFFLTGRWAEKYPDLARRIAEEGHEIGNHTYSHPDLTGLPDAEVLDEIRRAEEAIRQATGRESRPLFREPYGAFSEHERKLVRQAGYSYSIYWDVDTLDWQYPDVETLVSRIMKARGGSIVLMHMNVKETAIASDQAIPMLQAKGYRIVTVSELLRCQD